MPLDIQAGGFAEGIRRLMGVRGRMPLKLDETIVPVMQVDELNQPPWRSFPSDFGGNFVQTAVAAEYSFIGLNFPPTMAGAVVVDGIEIWGTAAETYVLHIGATSDYAATATAPVQDFTNLEHVRDNSGAVGVIPPMMAFNAQHGTHPTLGIGTRVWSGRVPADQRLIISRRFTIRPGHVLAVWRATVNLLLECSIYGTYYPDAPSQ